MLERWLLMRRPWPLGRRNPHNETRLHLARLAARHGYAIGEWSYGRPKVRFPESGARLSIGRYCSIADRVEILLGGDHRTDWVTTYPFAAMRGLWPGVEAPEDHHAGRGDVTIGHDAWLGSGAMILSGVRVGHGAVVGARAVVARDVPDYGIVVGNPARLVRLRFPEATVTALLAAAWWDLAPEQVGPLVPLLSSDRVDAFLDAVRRVRREGLGAASPAP